MLETRFSEVLNPDHELLRAAKLIDWDNLHDALSSYYSPVGRSGKPIRLMVGIHILKHRYNGSDETAVDMLHENAYWQAFCGYETFQRGKILDSTTLVKFRNRIGTEGMKRIEELLFAAWGNMGLVKTRQVIVDTTSQPKDIAYSTDADLLYRARKKIVKVVKRVREEVALRKPFRTFARVGKKTLITVKKFYRQNREKGQEGVEKLKAMTSSVVKQAEKVVKSLYGRGRKDLARSLNKAVSQGRKIVTQTEQALSGEKVKGRIYSLHEPDVAAIKKGKHHPPCEFGSLVALAMNDSGLILAHQEYQRNVADVKTLPMMLKAVGETAGIQPREAVADRGFDQPLESQKKLRKKWNLERLVIPRKGKTPHPDSGETWFRKALRKRTAIEPVIGHLKNDHRMNRCRYKGVQGDTANVTWAALAWNTKKIVQLVAEKQEKEHRRQRKRPQVRAAA